MRGVQAANYIVQIHKQPKTSQCFKGITVYILLLVFVVVMITLLLLSFQEELVPSPGKLFSRAGVSLDVTKNASIRQKWLC